MNFANILVILIIMIGGTTGRKAKNFSPSKTLEESFTVFYEIWWHTMNTNARTKKIREAIESSKNITFD